MSTDISQTLRDTENALRDFIAYILLEKLGPGWEGKVGVSPERLAKWAERKKIEGNRQDAGAGVFGGQVHALETPASRS